MSRPSLPWPAVVGLTTAVIAVTAAVGIATIGVMNRTEATFSPPAPLITDEIRKSTVIESMTLGGEFVPLDSRPIESPSSGSAIVTLVPAEVSGLGVGARLIDVSGVPIFALMGSLPGYRTLSIGSIGPDVSQLQSNLSSLGIAIKDDSGVFGRSTATALFDFYSSRGASPLDGAGQPIRTRWAAQSLVLPQNAIVYLNSFPADIRGGCLAVGSVLDAKDCSLESQASSIVARATVDDADRLEQGMAARIETAAGELAGSVGALRTEASSDDESSEDGLPVTIDIALDGPPPDGAGGAVSVAIELARSQQDELTVSVSAIKSTEPGAFFVWAMEQDEPMRIDVRVGLCNQDVCEIFADGDRIRPGTLVVVNR